MKKVETKDVVVLYPEHLEGVDESAIVITKFSDSIYLEGNPCYSGFTIPLHEIPAFIKELKKLM